MLDNRPAMGYEMLSLHEVNIRSVLVNVSKIFHPLLLVNVSFVGSAVDIK